MNINTTSILPASLGFKRQLRSATNSTGFSGNSPIQSGPTTDSIRFSARPVVASVNQSSSYKLSNQDVSGAVTIGNRGEISQSNIGGALTIGSSGELDQVVVTGPASISNRGDISNSSFHSSLKIGSSASLDNVTVKGKASVSNRGEIRNTTFLDNLTIGSSAELNDVSVQGITDLKNRGEISNSTFHSTLKIDSSGTLTNVIAMADVKIKGSATINGLSSANSISVGNIANINQLTMTGPVTIANRGELTDCSIDGALKIGSSGHLTNVTAKQATSIQGQATISDCPELRDLSVQSSATIANSKLTGHTYLGSSATLSGNTTVGSLQIDGTGKLYGVTLTDIARINGDADLTNTTAERAIRVYGNASFTTSKLLDTVEIVNGNGTLTGSEVKKQLTASGQRLALKGSKVGSVTLQNLSNPNKNWGILLQKTSDGQTPEVLTGKFNNSCMVFSTNEGEAIQLRPGSKAVYRQINQDHPLRSRLVMIAPGEDKNFTIASKNNEEGIIIASEDHARTTVVSPDGLLFQNGILSENSKKKSDKSLPEKYNTYAGYREDHPDAPVVVGPGWNDSINGTDAAGLYRELTVTCSSKTGKTSLYTPEGFAYLDGKLETAMYLGNDPEKVKSAPATYAGYRQQNPGLPIFFGPNWTPESNGKTQLIHALSVLLLKNDPETGKPSEITGDVNNESFQGEAVVIAEKGCTLKGTLKGIHRVEMDQIPEELEKEPVNPAGYPEGMNVQFLQNGSVYVESVTSSEGVSIIGDQVFINGKEVKPTSDQPAVIEGESSWPVDPQPEGLTTTLTPSVPAQADSTPYIASTPTSPIIPNPEPEKPASTPAPTQSPASAQSPTPPQESSGGLGGFLRKIFGSR